MHRRGISRSTRSATPRRRSVPCAAGRQDAARPGGPPGACRGAARPRSLPQARSPSADRRVQDPRRAQRRPPAHERSAGRRRLDGQRRQRGPRRRVRRAAGRRALLGDGGRHGASRPSSRPSSGSAPPSSGPRTTSAGARSNSTRSDRMTRLFHPSVRRRSVHRGKRDGGTRNHGRSAGRRCRRCVRSAAAACWRALPRPCARSTRTTRSLCRGTRDRGAAQRVAGGWTAGVLRQLARVVRGRRRRQVGARHDVAARCGTSTDRSSCRSTMWPMPSR